MIRLSRWLVSAYLNTSLSVKLIWIFVLLILIPVSLTNLFGYLKYKDSIQQNAESYTYTIIGKMLRELDDSTKELERLSAVMLYHTQFEADLSLTGDTYEKQGKMSYYINFLQNVMKQNSSVYIFDNDGHAYYNNSVRPNLERKYAEWSRLAHANEGKGVIAGTELVEDYFGNERYLLTTVRELRSRFDLHSLGVIVIDSDLSGYESIVTELDQLTKGTTLLLDASGDVIMHTGSDAFSASIQALRSRYGNFAGQGKFTFQYDGQSYLCNFDSSAQSNWTMVVATPVDVLLGSATETRNVTLLITAIAIGAALIVAAVSVMLLTRPLKSMESLMKNVQDGNFQIRFQVRHKDEIGRLGTYFNRMVQRIGELIEQVYATELRKNKAELELLQSQINPHFLYNTLEMIRMAAEMNRDAQVSHMVFVLGKLLRHGISRKGASVTLEQEIEHVKNYLFLHNLRSGSHASLDVRVDDGLLGMQMMRLVFQPIVENALIHGGGDEPYLQISIRSSIESGRLLFEIRDNGKGMSRDRLSEVSGEISGALTKAASAATIGIGMKNVNDRIQLHYGPEYGLTLDSLPGEGTAVWVRLPLPEPALPEPNAS